MPLTSAIATPQPLRSDPLTSRFSYESELWDDMANAQFGGKDDGTTTNANYNSYTSPTGPGSINLYLPVATRLWVYARTHVYVTCDAAWSVRVVPLFDAISPGVGSEGYHRMPNLGTADFMELDVVAEDVIDMAPGKYAFGMFIFKGGTPTTIQFVYQRWWVRRGRKP